MSKPNTENILTKDGALRLLSKQLRHPNLQPLLFVKVLTLFSKIAGWDNDATPSPEPSLDELVARIEKDRENAQY